MLEIVIEGIPVPWMAHQGFGRKSFNPRFKEKQFYQWQIRNQFNREHPILGPVSITSAFYLPVPKATSSIRKSQMLNGVMHHIKRPDLDNFNKFLHDCLKTIVIEDDSQIVEMHCKKLYGEKPKTIVKVEFF